MLWTWTPQDRWVEPICLHFSKENFALKWSDLEKNRVIPYLEGFFFHQEVLLRGAIGEKGRDLLRIKGRSEDKRGRGIEGEA